MCSEVMLVGQRFARRPDKGHIWLCAFAAAAGQGAHATFGSLGLACCDLLWVTHSVAIFSCLAATLLRACLADRLDLGACVFRCKCAAGAPHQAHCAILPRPACCRLWYTQSLLHRAESADNRPCTCQGQHHKTPGPVHLPQELALYLGPEDLIVSVIPVRRFQSVLQQHLHASKFSCQQVLKMLALSVTQHSSEAVRKLLLIRCPWACCRRSCTAAIMSSGCFKATI